MNSIVANILKRKAAASRTETKPFNVVVLFCGVGLVGALVMASLGFDLGAGFF
jgi:hypothetical protein